MAKKLSELDEAFAAGASVDAYPPRMVARMAAAPANVNYVKRQVPPPEAPMPAPAPSNSGERLRQVQNIANAGANPQAFLNQEAPKMPRGKPDPMNTADTTKIVNRVRTGSLQRQLTPNQNTAQDLSEGWMGAPGRFIDSLFDDAQAPAAPASGNKNDGQNATYVPPSPGLTDEERASIAGMESAKKYLSERKPLAAGVTRYDAGLETPSNVYATVDKNGNRVYTDNANYAASVTDGVGRMPQNAQTQLRAKDLAADTNRNFEYTAPITDLNGIAEMRRNLPNMPAGARQAIEAALPEAERAANIEAARTGSRPVDLRRKAEGADLTAGKNLYRPPGAGDAKGALTPYQMLQTQLGMMDRQDRADNTAYTRDRDAREDARREAQDAAGATKAEQDRMDKDLNTVFDVQKRLTEVDADGFPVNRPEDLLAPIMTMIPEDPDAALDFLTNNPAGQQIAKMYDEVLTRQARQQGGYSSRLDDDVRVDAGDLRFANPNDPSSSMYFEEGDEGLFGLTGRAELGSVAQQAQRVSTTPNRISALLRNRQTQQQRTERK